MLPTIRSRCRTLRLAPLGAEDLGRALVAALGEAAPEAAALGPITALAGGSVGAAIGLAAQDGADIYSRLIALAQLMPGADRQALLALAETAAGRGAEARFDLIVALLEQLLARLARTGILGPPTPEALPGEGAILARLSPDPDAARGWADLAQGLIARLRAGRAVNLDPAALLVDMMLKMDAAAQRLGQR